MNPVCKSCSPVRRGRPLRRRTRHACTKVQLHWFMGEGRGLSRLPPLRFTVHLGPRACSRKLSSGELVHGRDRYERVLDRPTPNRPFHHPTSGPLESGHTPASTTVDSSPGSITTRLPQGLWPHSPHDPDLGGVPFCRILDDEFQVARDDGSNLPEVADNLSPMSHEGKHASGKHGC